MGEHRHPQSGHSITREPYTLRRYRVCHEHFSADSLAKVCSAHSAPTGALCVVPDRAWFRRPQASVRSRAPRRG